MVLSRGVRYVSRIFDGDTIQLSTGETVRYIGIDTPEIRRKKGGEWVYDPMPFSRKAKEFNAGMVKGRPVELEFDVQKRDKFGRLLAYVYAGDEMVNEELLKNGYAVLYTYPPNVKHTREFVKAQTEAREKERGLWKGLKENVIPASEACRNIGKLRAVSTRILDTYISDKVLVLKCEDDFKIVVFGNNFSILPKEGIRSPDSYFKGRNVKVHGIIREYRGSSEIILHTESQIKLL